MSLTIQHVFKSETMLSHTADESDYPSEVLALTIGNDLVERGWSQQPFFLSAELTQALAMECHLLIDSDKLRPAGMGRGTSPSLRPEIRGDRIGWLNAGQSLACDRYLHIMEDLRTALNRTLYLGLDEYESHFAFYPPGASYQKHLDRFQDDDRRTLSAVIYLNPDWLPEHGGALRLHPEGKCTQDIVPSGSRLALFLSSAMLHEVLPATRDRLSLTGWFKRRA